jgi:hypothetical protein
LIQFDNSEDRNAKTGQFLSGHKVKGGRKLGSRNKLATQYSDDIYKKWKRYCRSCLDTLGKNAIDCDVTAAKAFVNAVCSHLPKEVTAKIFSASIELAGESAQQFALAYDLALQLANGEQPQEPLLIEHDDHDQEQ